MRLIARLDIKGDHVIKGIQLEGLRKVGKPKEMAVRYSNQRADELLFMDAVASLYDRNSLFPIIEQACREVFIPVTVGGGIRTMDDIRTALRSGADKVAINTAAIKNPEFIREAADHFGSQAIVGSIETRGREAYTDNGREPTGRDAAEWAQELEHLGAGELLITSVDRDGTKKGLDIDLAKEINDLVSIPVVASGGLGKPDHARDLPRNMSFACATVLHYGICSMEDLRG